MRDCSITNEKMEETYKKIGQNVIYSLKTSVLEDMLKMLSDLTGREDK